MENKQQTSSEAKEWDVVTENHRMVSGNISEVVAFILRFERREGSRRKAFCEGKGRQPGFMCLPLDYLEYPSLDVLIFSQDWIVRSQRKGS